MISWFKDRRLKNDPQKQFLVYQNRSYTIEELSLNISTIQKVFSVSKINKQDKLVVFLPNGVDIVEIILACFESGIIVVPISIKFTKIELKKIIKLINPKVIVTNWELKNRVDDLGITTLEIEEFHSIARVCQVYESNYRIKKNDVAAIILTSGTTDVPKAVELTYQNFEASCQNWDSFLNFKNNDQFLCCLPLYHIGGLAVLVRALIYDFSINLAESFNSDLLYNLIKANPVSIVSLVPTMLEKIINKPDGIDCLLPLRAILLGGGPASNKLLDKCLKNKLNIVKTYGMTETCSGIVGLWIKDYPNKKESSGKPFKDVKIKVINNEVHIKGPMVMKGYLNEKKNNEYHNSKDIGWLDKDNNLFIEMRRKDLIVSGGENINPKEIELLLMKIKNIQDCAIVGVPDDKWGQKVVAYICMKDKNNSISPKEIVDYLLIDLSKYKIPKEFVFVDFIPRNEIGKVIIQKVISL